MNSAVEKLVKPVMDNSINLVTNALGASRQFAVSGAKILANGKTPVHVVTDSTLKLNAISHDSVARLLSVQFHSLEGTLLATAKRLETAANANSMSELVNDQVALFPATRERLTKDARDALDVLTDARDGIREVVTATVSGLGRGESVASKARSAAKRTTKAAKTTTKKAASKTRKTATRAKKTVKKATR